MDSEEQRLHAITMHTQYPSKDKSFIIKLKQFEQQAIEAVQQSTPCVESQHQDGIRLGALYMVQDIIKAYKAFP